MLRINVSEVTSNLITKRHTGIGAMEVSIADLDTAMELADVYGQLLAEGVISDAEVTAMVTEAMHHGYPTKELWLFQNRVHARARQLAGASQALYH